MSEVELLKQQNAQLTQSLILEKFNAAITAGSITPAEYNKFNQRYGDKATLADATTWIQTAPKPPRSNTGRPQTYPGASEAVADRPDLEIVRLTKERQATHFKTWNEKISFIDAQKMLFKDDDPSTKEAIQSYTRWSLRTASEM